MQKRVYAGAAINRLNADWIMSPLSADGSIRGDLKALRERSRTLVRDNALAARFIRMCAENIIGPDGIRLQSRIRDAKGELDRAANRLVQDAWAEWCQAENASVDGIMSMTEIAELAVTSWKQDGEALIRIWRGYDNRHGFALQPIDADLLDHTFDRAPAPGVNEIRMGVERNPFGKPVAYWLWSSHPSDMFASNRERVRVPAADIIHIYRVLRPGQTRGVPVFAPVMSDVNMLGGYQEAELVAARMGAAQMGFIEQGEDAPGIDPDEPVNTPMEAEPGTFSRLARGEKLHTFSPEHPTTAFGPFVKCIQRSIASGLNVSYTALTGDLEAANYSSLRDGSLKERDGYRADQRFIARTLYRRAFLEWIRIAAVYGVVKVPTVDARRYTEHAWLPRGWAWVDPEKDMRAALMEIGGALNTHANVAAANGRDFEEILEQLDDENDLAAEYGIALTSDVKVPAPAAPAEKPAAEAKDDDRARLAVA